MPYTNNAEKLDSYLAKFQFNEDNQSKLSADSKTKITEEEIADKEIKKYVNEFWTSKQRKGVPIHEISYRACFKPQLPKFFIDLLTKEGDIVYDPFSGRGTTAIEAALNARNIISNDINPLSEILTKPRLNPPTLNKIKNRLATIELDKSQKANIDLSMFFHPDTEGEIVSLKNYLKERKSAGTEDNVDSWIRMVATNRLTGHSKGFFSVYTLPPNQAVSPESQKKINEKRKQAPEYRDVKKRIEKKSKRLLKSLTQEHKDKLKDVSSKAFFLTEDARDTTRILPETIQLTVTSPPFLDIVQYSKDNWLRCWFNTIDDKETSKRITISRSIEKWSDIMGEVFKELHRITKPGGWVAFEVGEVRKGKVKLDEYVVPLGLSAGFDCFGILINSQKFTKTSNIWGINNNHFGTNTNRIVLFSKKQKG